MADKWNYEGAFQELTRALDNHEQWHKEFMRTIVCRLPYDSRDIADDAHRQCRFGQWLYGSATLDWRAHEIFADIEVEHERMHQLAAKAGSPTCK